MTDLRSWLEKVESFGELRHVLGAHWDTELGAIAELSYRTPEPKALLFDDIDGYATGRVLTGSTGSARRLGLTLGLGDDLDDAAVVAALRGKPSVWAATARDHPTETVTSSPLLDNVVEGRDVDLLSLPVPRWHAEDGGRFIGTGCLVITTDPETKDINGGCYRMEVVEDGRSATIAAVPGKHGAQHVRRWFDRGEKAPVVVSFGHHPVLLVTGGTEVPTGISELEYAGAILGERLPVLIGEHTGLPIPAGSEVAIEGWLSPDHLADEGPFGEWTGYYSGRRRPAPALEIARMYHRDDPVLLGAPPGKPPHDYSYMRTVMKSAMIEDALVAAGVPGVRGAWAHEAGGGRLFIAVSVETRYAGHSTQVGHLTAQLPAAAYMNRFVVVVDDDIDVANLDEVVWAMSTRCDPVRDIDVVGGTWGSKLDPMLVEGAPPYNSRAVVDATRPYDRRATFPKVSTGDPAYLRSVMAKWADVFS
ncbi:UbiD family decarboxylase [Actinophytocola algeriensis]|uniref:4-hydroxy-3-polyprenylbenzoate decarboxylase n=1 Tax=Actinophytocola algeriensis TaxID=1768010 RepID=A0A7W7VGX9_9PSEU|nr:UbiD family decarboxylase [Actinophytocola algeriensis]MBB4909510.1 4-hydroxy-3-polyprenylbenzoate decarboxylase [Actinophytocola algeriensis]MBE1475500.1 4-hydroxy-3-polyprenylbenzoate decarboxylase [Actinophytocola algeriensis]